VPQLSDVNIKYNVYCCTVHIASIHFYFTNTSTCESHIINVNILKLLELQHVSVFHKTILREPFVPVKVTCCPLLFFKLCWQHVVCL